MLLAIMKLSGQFWLPWFFAPEAPQLPLFGKQAPHSPSALQLCKTYQSSK